MKKQQPSKREFRDRFDPPVSYLAVASLISYLILTALVQARMVAGLDLAATVAVQPLSSALLDTVGGLLSIVFSAEVSMLLTLALALFLWRKGAGYWSLAPFVVWALVALELVSKLLVDQPPVPAEFHHAVGYPLTTVSLPGTFPSGHALRGAFFCTFLAVFLARSGGWRGSLGVASASVIIGLGAFTRVYLGHHWLSDVVGGTILGASLALALAIPIARQRYPSIRP